MRTRDPRITSLDQVTIERNGDTAIIRYHDPSIATTHFRMGAKLQGMSDEEVLLEFNRFIAAQVRHRDELGEFEPIEVHPGIPQVEYHPHTQNQFTPTCDVLRCIIEDGGGDDGSVPTIYIDDQAYTWEQFGGMLCTYAGWGMRIVFVPDDELDQIPTIIRATKGR